MTAGPRYALAVGFTALLVVSAGCTGMAQSGRQSTTTTATPSITTTVLEGEEAKQQVLDAERSRVKQILANATNLTSVAVGTYGSPSATVVNRSVSGVYVRITMTYSYEYDCGGGESGAVDADTTRAVYRVTANQTTITRIEERVRNICH